MKAIQAIYQNGEIKPLEPVPDVKSASVLIIFPNAPEFGVSAESGQQDSPGEDWEARMFGCGKDWWTDEVDAAVRESWKVRTRPPEFEVSWDAEPEGGSREKDNASL